MGEIEQQIGEFKSRTIPKTAKKRSGLIYKWNISIVFRQGMLHGLMAISHIGQLCIIEKELHKAESGLLVQFVLLLLQHIGDVCNFEL